MGNTILVVGGSRIGSWWVGAEKLGGLRAWGRRACCLVFSQGGKQRDAGVERQTQKNRLKWPVSLGLIVW